MGIKEDDELAEVTNLLAELEAVLTEAQDSAMRTAENIEKALRIASEHGATDGAHHKMWVIDQMVRVLAGDQYGNFLKTTRYDWDEGIAP